jgi:hypothetical protein
VRRPALIALVTATLGATLAAAPAAGATDPCEPPVQSVIACENSKPGTPPAQWQVAGSGDPTILGFTTEFSVNVGETVRFKVATDAAAYTINVYRIGWYQGHGARHVASVSPSVPLPQPQPYCLTDPSTGLIDCGNWAVSATWDVPADAVSGVYVARLRRNDTGGASHVLFVVRDDQRDAALLFQTNDTTWHAYNDYGGNSLYAGTPAGRAFKVSYNRPFVMRGRKPYAFFWSDQYGMVRFLERNGYDVSYFAGVDADRIGAEIADHQVFLSVGHDEYWSNRQRQHVEAARDAGVHLAFFSGNEVFWKTRWEPSIDGSNTPHRTLVCYKETHAGAKIDPSPEWTGTWADPRFSPPADGGRPQNALTGTLFRVNGPRSDAIRVPAELGRMRLWRHTSISSLPDGAEAVLPTGTLGFEWDEAPDNDVRPAGLFPLSDTTVAITDGKYLLDHGSTYGNGTARHQLVLHRAASGALVFGAGTIQWHWGLDTENDQGGSTPDVRMQQATVNLLADMGVQPATLMAGLVPAAASADTQPPTATVDSPAAGATVAVNQPITITGTAVDLGGGRVGAVEVSVDGEHWRVADGREQWSFGWTPMTVGPHTIRVRAVDDTGNLSAPAAPVTVIAEIACPCRLFNDTVVPATPAVADPNPVELGVKFQPQASGYVTGLRFYRGPGNTGPNVGSLWSASGVLLGRATFPTGSGGGWQQVTLPTPVFVQGGATYVASYHAPQGRYAADAGGLAAGRTVPPLRAPPNGEVGGNGVYAYSTTPTFPTFSYGATNYYVDVVFDLDDTTPPVITGRAPLPGDSGVPVATAVRATFHEPVQPTSIVFELRDPAGAAVPATVGYDPLTRTATLRPTQPLASGVTYRARLSGATDVVGNTMVPVEWTFTTGGVDACPCSIWSALHVPAVEAVGDTNAVEVGVRFRAAVTGRVTGVRFYKGPGNGGTHTGSLWTNGGALLARVTFTGETASGWQTALFATPVVVQAGQTYVASYHAPQGRYAAEPGAFAAGGVDNPPLSALASGLDGPNGVYAYGATPRFPTATHLQTSYGVDVLFLPGAGTPVTVGDTTSADFGAGTHSATYVSETGDGEVILAPTVGAEFSGTALPAGFTATAWQSGATVTVGGGRLRVDGARVGTAATYAPGRSLEVVATFAAGAANQVVGFGTNLSSTPWLTFDTRGGGSLWARSASSSISQTNTDLGAGFLGAPRRFRIDWQPGSVTFSVDGVVVATHARNVTTALRPLVSDRTSGGPRLEVDWLRLGPVAPSGTFTSRVWDGGGPTTWTQVAWSAAVPTGAVLTVEVRSGPTPTPGTGWSPFVAVANGGSAGLSGRYAQVRVAFVRSGAGATPELASIGLSGFR